MSSSLISLKKYKPLSEEELAKYYPIANKAMSKFIRKDYVASPVAIFCSEEDLSNELYPILLEAVRSFDDSKNRTIEGWIYFKCYSRLISVIRDKYWIKRDSYKKLTEEEREINKISVNSELLQDLVYEEPYHELEEKEFADYLFKDLSFKDPVRGYNILYKLYVQKNTLQEIGDFYGVSKQAIKGLVYRVKPEILLRAKQYITQIK